jgi:hypothetical protein
MISLHHRTREDIAKRIVTGGFSDGDGYRMTNNHHSGVLFSHQPLEADEGAFGNTLIRIRLDEREIAQFEWVERGKSYREWLIPVQLVNCSKSAEIVTVERKLRPI